MNNKFQYLGGRSGEDNSFLFWLYDQRRYFAVRGTEDILPNFKRATEILDECAEDLLPDDVVVTVCNDGKFLTFSNRDEEDQGDFFRYPRFDHQTDDFKEDIVKRSDLCAKQRMYWLADIVSYVDGQNNHHLAGFKIAVHFSQLKRMWNDFHIMRALKRASIHCPLRKFVVDDTDHRLVGMTSTFIPGGTLEDNHSVTQLSPFLADSND